MPPLPLAGLRVLLTRPQGDGADAWAAAFASVGATPILYPTTTLAPPASWADVDAALANLANYHWLVFTSQTAVSAVLGRLPGGNFSAMLRPKLAAVGAKTAEAIARGGRRADVIATDQRQEGLSHAFETLPSGTRVLLPMAAGGRTFLAEELRARGCCVDVVAVYQTVPNTDLPPPPAFDVATFASPSSLRAFLGGPGKSALAGKCVAVIGPTTAREATAQGLLATVARSPSVQALIRAIAESRRGKGEP
jgi:uroporphyrinogen-III synthase